MYWALLFRITRITSSYFLRLALFFGLLVTSAYSSAIEGVTIVLSEEAGVYSEFAVNLSNILTQSTTNRPAVKIITANKFSTDDLPRTTANQMIVAVGTTAMVALAQKPTAIPVLNVLIPQNNFYKITRQNSRLQDSRKFSAIFVDQSWARQLGLIQVSMSGHPRVGVLLGKEETESIPALQSAAKDADMSLNIETVTDDAELLTALRKLLANSDALLAVPDPKIYNRNNISSILLTSYRQQIPLFGFSASYVKAGALASVYSLPAQVSQQVAEIINNLPASGNLPPPQYPRYFSINTNPQVARSLGINIAPEPELQYKLKHLTERAP